MRIATVAWSLAILVLLGLFSCPVLAVDLHAYNGQSVAGVDRTTLVGKFMCGYQGWFDTPTDGAGRGWVHYGSHGKFAPGSCCIDLWPDVSELGPDELYPTPFHLADGSMAPVFSSQNPRTVLRHFKWMQQYGIDGVFVQRFVNETIARRNLDHCDTVLDSCRAAANQTGRVYAVMYDLSGMQGSKGVDHVIDDWKMLVDQMHIGHDENDKAYLFHHGHPVVAVWGIGFNDHRPYTTADCKRFIDFLKFDPRYGHNTVMIGVPTGWRTANMDAIADPQVIEIAREADIISPWTVGRYGTLAGVEKHAQQRWAPDITWCKAHDKDYLPVVFPGFSWHNMHVPVGQSTKPTPPLNQIPRLKGEFEWAQCVAAKRAGATTIYQAMFDEMDEGTAIFKITSNPPVGPSKFVTPEGLPSDEYLWLAGQAGKMLRGEVPVSDRIPVRK